MFVPAGSPSHGGDMAFMSFDTSQPSFPTPFYCALGVSFCFCGPLNCISFHKFCQQLSAFSLCSSGFVSALSVLSTINIFLKVSLNFSLRVRLLCMAPVLQLGEVSWSVVCAAYCHMALVFAVMRLHIYCFYSFFFLFFFSSERRGHDSSVS